MDRQEFNGIEKEIDDKGKIDEETARRLVAVAQGKEAGDATADEARDLLGRAYVGRALKIIDAIVAESGGAEIDEGKCLDRTVEAIRMAAAKYEPTDGTFDRWCADLMWCAVMNVVTSRMEVAERIYDREGSTGARADVLVAMPDAAAAAVLDRVEATLDIDARRRSKTRRPLANGDALMRRRRPSRG